MDSSLHFGIISLIVISFHMNLVSSLECHVCNTRDADEQDCFAIPEDNTKYLQHCPAARNKTCRILEQWVDFEVLGQKTGKRTIRQCASTRFDPQRACYYRTGFGGRINVCNCVGDGCNEATKFASVSFVVLGTLLLVNMFVRKSVIGL